MSSDTSKIFRIDSEFLPDDFSAAMKKLTDGNYNLKDGKVSIYVEGQIDFDANDPNKVKYNLALKRAVTPRALWDDFHIYRIDWYSDNSSDSYFHVGWDKPSKELWCIDFYEEFPSKEKAEEFLKAKLAEIKTTPKDLNKSKEVKK